MVIYSTWNFQSELINILSMHYHELMRNIKEHAGKLNWWVMIISIEKFDVAKILTDTDDKLPN